MKQLYGGVLLLLLLLPLAAAGGGSSWEYCGRGPGSSWLDRNSEALAAGGGWRGRDGGQWQCGGRVGSSGAPGAPPGPLPPGPLPLAHAAAVVPAAHVQQAAAPSPPGVHVVQEGLQQGPAQPGLRCHWRGVVALMRMAATHCKRLPLTASPFAPPLPSPSPSPPSARSPLRPVRALRPLLTFPGRLPVQHHRAVRRAQRHGHVQQRAVVQAVQRHGAQLPAASVT